MQQQQNKILVGLIASASLATLVVVMLRTSRPPGSSDSVAGEPTAPGHAGIDSRDTKGSDSVHVETAEPNRRDPPDPGGHEKGPATGVQWIVGVKDEDDKRRCIVQLADTSAPERLEALGRLGCEIANKPTPPDPDILRAVQLAASDPDAAIREKALYYLIGFSDPRSFEIVTERLFDDPSREVKERAISCLRSVGNPDYLASLNLPEESLPPGLLGERKTAARTALKAARVNADEDLAVLMDNALDNLKE